MGTEIQKEGYKFGKRLQAVVLMTEKVLISCKDKKMRFMGKL